MDRNKLRQMGGVPFKYSAADKKRPIQINENMDLEQMVPCPHCNLDMCCKHFYHHMKIHHPTLLMPIPAIVPNIPPENTSVPDTLTVDVIVPTNGGDIGEDVTESADNVIFHPHKNVLRVLKKAATLLDKHAEEETSRETKASAISQADKVERIHNSIKSGNMSKAVSLFKKLDKPTKYFLLK